MPSLHSTADPPLHRPLARRIADASVTLTVCLFVWHTFCLTAAAIEPLASNQAFTQRLQEPHTGLVDGQGLRNALLLAAKNNRDGEPDENLWIDRKVNPDTPVSPGTLGPTRYASLCRIAEEADCVCFPLNNCILIGRPQWVAAMLRSFFSEDGQNARSRRRVQHESPPVDIAWPDLTTPSEALARVQRAGTATLPGHPANDAIPHDLWPATSLHNLSPQVAIDLIRGQFLPIKASNTTRDGVSPGRDETPLERSYQFPNSGHFFEAASKVDPAATFVREGPRYHLTANLETHALLCEQLLSRPRGEVSGDSTSRDDALQRLRQDTRTFTLNVRNQPAGRVLASLVANLQIQCRFDPAANPQLEQLVSFSAKDQTLWQLVRLIMDKASLKIEAAEGTLLISAQ